MGRLSQLWQSPPEPVFMGAYSSKGFGQWYAGAVPKGGEDAPVLVFVPGLNDIAQNFWSRNGFDDPGWGLYAYAFRDGYRTAFVNFTPRGEKPFDVWQDGRILAWQLERICDHFRVRQVHLIAHSKGGVDAQTAMVYYGAAQRVSGLVTLSTPHWGSQLADIAYSSSGWALAELLQMHNEGCFTMQTGFMSYYRQRTDNKPENVCKIQTFAGRGSGIPLSKTWAGAQMMSRYGPNDGVVTVASAQNPKGEHLATLDLSHEQMKEGRYIWPYLSAALRGQPLPEQAAARPQQAMRCGQILRGGAMGRGIDDSFFIDGSVGHAEITLLLTGAAGSAANEVALADPYGRVYGSFASAPADGGLVLSLSIDRPAVGGWRLRAPGCEGAYTAVIGLCGANIFETVPETRQPGRSVALRVWRTGSDRSEPVGDYTFTRVEQPLPQLPPGSYLLEATASGEAEDGSRFERSVIRTAIVDQGGDELGEFLSQFL